MSKRDSKVYVLDTSVLIHDPTSIKQLGDNRIIIPISVLSELDGLKKREGNVGMSAREAISLIESLTNNDLNPATLRQGVRLDTGGLLSFDLCQKEEDWSLLPSGLERNMDAYVLLAAKKATSLNGGNAEVVLLSQDLNLRVIARSLGIKAEGFRRDRLITNLDEMYSGRRVINLSRNYAGLITQMYARDGLEAKTLEPFVGAPLNPHECLEVTVEHEKYTMGVHQRGIVRAIKGELPTSERLSLAFKTPEQAMAYHLATSQDVQLATFSGKTGSGKTFISLLAAHILTRHQDNRRIIVFRPNIELGPKLGLLPGDINDKFSPWIRPVVEIMRKIYLSMGYQAAESERLVRELINAGFLEINPITHIRGCTFDNAVIMIDEGQNLTPHEIRSAITRAGENTTIFITGDPSQVDNRFLDSRNNGLVFVTERFRGDQNFAHLTFTKSVRSPLAEKAAVLLNM